MAVHVPKTQAKCPTHVCSVIQFLRLPTQFPLNLYSAVHQLLLACALLIINQIFGIINRYLGHLSLGIVNCKPVSLILAC